MGAVLDGVPVEAAMAGRRSRSEWGGFVVRLDLERIRAAMPLIAPVFRGTPQYECEQLGALLGCRITLKVESLNPVRCFKGRGTETVLARIWSSWQSVDTLARAVIRCFDDVAHQYGESGYQDQWGSPFPSSEPVKLRTV